MIESNLHRWLNLKWVCVGDWIWNEFASGDWIWNDFVSVTERMIGGTMYGWILTCVWMNETLLWVWKSCDRMTLRVVAGWLWELLPDDLWELLPDDFESCWQITLRIVVGWLSKSISKSFDQTSNGFTDDKWVYGLTKMFTARTFDLPNEWSFHR